MKIGRKGFMLAEVVVISVVLATVLITLYIGLNNIVSAYETRNRYYDIECLHAAMEMNDILLRNIESLNGMVTDASFIYDWASNNEVDENLIQDFGEFYSETIGDRIAAYIIPYNKEQLLSLKSYDYNEDQNSNKTFTDYLHYLSGNFDFNADYDYIIIVERRENKDIDDCYYYALKLKY